MTEMFLGDSRADQILNVVYVVAVNIDNMDYLQTIYKSQI